MSNFNLVGDTLNYGRKNANSSSVITLIVILLFIFGTYALLKLHSRFTNDKKYSTGKKQLLKVIPTISIVLIFVLIFFYLSAHSIDNKKVWQADYFMGFVLNIVIMFISSIAYLQTTTLLKTKTKTVSMPLQRRKLSQFFINGTFKTSFFLFWVLLLTPYYVFCIGQEGTLRDSGYAWLSLSIFIFMSLICFFTFGKSPFAPLLPCIVFWGACIHYYDIGYALWYGATLNGTSLAVTLGAFLFGFGFFNFLDPKLKTMKGLWAMLYIWLLGIVIFGIWYYLWWFYGYDVGGTGYKHFYRESFIPTK
jgi:hypothetical protein